MLLIADYLLNIAIPINGILSVKINEKAARPMLVKADLVVWAVSPTAAFIEHIDHTAV